MGSEAAGWLVKKQLAGSIYPIDLGAELHNIEIDLHNSTLGPNKFYEYCKVGLKSLA